MSQPTPNSIIIIITPPPTHNAITVTYDPSLTLSEVLESLQQIVNHLQNNPVG